MRLSEYLERAGISYTEFARRLGVSRHTVSRYASGERVPRPEIQQAIFRLTGGLVTPSDFVLWRDRSGGDVAA